MNSTVGVKQMFSQKEALTIVAQSLDANKPTVMLEAVRVLAAVCLIPPDGHERVIEAITMSGEMRRLTNRFQPVVDALLKGNPQLRVSYTCVIPNKFYSIFIRRRIRNQWDDPATHKNECTAAAFCLQ